MAKAFVIECEVFVGEWMKETSGHGQKLGGLYRCDCIEGSEPTKTRGEMG